MVFCSVCAGVLFRRYHVHGSGEPVGPVLKRLGAVVLVRWVEEGQPGQWCW